MKRVHQEASEFIKLLQEKHLKQNTIPRQNCSIFLFNEKLYNRRSKSSLKRRKVNTVYFGSENFLSLETKICELVPIKNKNKLLSSCKSQINTGLQINARTKSIKHISVKQDKKQPSEVFCKESCSKNFAEFTGKHLYLYYFCFYFYMQLFFFHLFLYHIFYYFALISYISCQYELDHIRPN